LFAGDIVAFFTDGDSDGNGDGDGDGDVDVIVIVVFADDGDVVAFLGGSGGGANTSSVVCGGGGSGRLTDFIADFAFATVIGVNSTADDAAVVVTVTIGVAHISFVSF
jgi:hypothetical protein